MTKNKIDNVHEVQTRIKLDELNHKFEREFRHIWKYIAQIQGRMGIIENSLELLETKLELVVDDLEERKESG